MFGIQAGVAMGLAKTVAVRFPEWGPDFATLMVSTAALLPVFKQPVHEIMPAKTCTQQC